MADIDFIIRLQREIKKRLASLSLGVTSGAIDNFDKYKYITGQIAAYEAVLQEISNLLEKKEQYEDTGNVIRIDKDQPGPKN